MSSLCGKRVRFLCAHHFHAVLVVVVLGRTALLKYMCICSTYGICCRYIHQFPIQYLCDLVLVQSLIHITHADTSDGVSNNNEKTEWERECPKISQRVFFPVKWQFYAALWRFQPNDVLCADTNEQQAACSVRVAYGMYTRWVDRQRFSGMNLWWQSETGDVVAVNWIAHFPLFMCADSICKLISTV